MRTYESPQEGEWVQPVRRGYKLCCCDCGLVHNVDFRISGGRIQFRVFRNNRSTGQIRRYLWAELDAELAERDASERKDPPIGERPAEPLVGVT